MAKCELKETMVREVVLRMTETEALVLITILCHVDGDPEKSRRRFSESVLKSLRCVLSKSSNIWHHDVSGKIEFASPCSPLHDCSPLHGQCVDEQDAF